MGQASQDVSPEAAREELARILASDGFVSSKRLQRFLSFAVERALEGRANEIKETTLGIEVFDRGPSFDSRTDTIVRVEARRLRRLLAAYYGGPGKDDPVVIDVPKGAYSPVFRSVPAPVSHPGWRTAAAVGAVLLAAGLVAAWMIGRPARGDGASATRSATAQSRFSEGRYLRAQRTPESLELSLAKFEQAVAADPNFAAAWAALAEVSATLGFHSLAPAPLAIARARTAAQKAIELDAGIASAHGALGWIRVFYDWDWRGAEVELQRALELDPGAAIVHQWYAFGLAAHGRFDEAVSQGREAAALDAAFAATTDLAMVLYYAGRYEAAMEEARRVLSLKPDFLLAHAVTGACLAATGRHAEAIAAYRRSSGDSDRFSTVQGRLGLSLAVSGRRAEAQSVLDRLEEAARRGGKVRVEMALIHVGLGAKDRACELLERAAEDREPDLMFLAVEPLFANLRREARFRAVAARVEFAD